MQKCKKCDADSPDDAEYCTKCGSDFKPSEDTLIFSGLGDLINKAIDEESRIHDIESEFINSIGIRFKKAPKGEFMMGSNEWPDTKPVHKVTFTKGFFMGIYPVTQNEWQEIMGENPSYFKAGERPVECVSWIDCQLFIKKLNAKEGHSKYRLPSEAEWEYGCRANADTDYFFGSDLKQLIEYGWFYDNAKNDGTHPVGTRQPNSWGFSDMYGNIWEWCQDWYGPYSGEDAVDPHGPSKGNVKVHRGGSWCNDALLCSSVFRRFNNPQRRRHNLGFRLVMSL